MKSHRDLAEFNALFPAVREIQVLAQRHGIADIFQDNGGKLLQVLLMLGLTIVDGREGNDARDESGREYEVKTVNANLVQCFSTHHHLNPVILAKYRSVDWVFGVYRGIELERIYIMPPVGLEVYFSRWEKKWHDKGGRDINNPKIALGHVVRNGTVLYDARS